MGLQINNEANLQNSLINNLYSKVQGYTSSFLNTDTKDFADYLKNNFDEIDKNADKTLSKSEITAQTVTDRRNEELKKILDNKSLEKLTSNVDTNQDGSVEFSEVNPNSNVPNILQGALRNIQNTKDWGFAAQNLTQSLCKNYYASPMMTAAATSAINCIL